MVNIVFRWLLTCAYTARIRTVISSCRCIFEYVFSPWCLSVQMSEPLIYCVHMNNIITILSISWGFETVSILTHLASKFMMILLVREWSVWHHNSVLTHTHTLRFIISIKTKDSEGEREKTKRKKEKSRSKARVVDKQKYSYVSMAISTHIQASICA